MQINPIARTVRLSVGELASFRNLPQSERLGGSSWRATVGQDWHKKIQANTSAKTPQARFEISIKAHWRHREWTFELLGRMDQIIPTPAGSLKIREVKTVREALPVADETLFQKYPEYFAQVASYLALAQVLPEYDGQALSAQLLFIDIESGALQEVELNEQHSDCFQQQLDVLIPFLNDRRNARIHFQKAEIQPAFETLREGQAELFATLTQASIQAKTVLLEAPTGFGKTGIVLEHALRQMQNGVYERCIYLTSKSTGQLETIRQLRSMIGDGLHFIQMRNRNEHRIESTTHTCTGDTSCDAETGQRWFEANLHASQLFEQGTLSLERAKTIGTATGVCPYALTKACLPFAEVWIGDSNYVFSPASRTVFFDQYGFDPAKTLLVIDEAHNLPDRTADALSLTLQSVDLISATEALRATGAPRKLLSTGNELIRTIEALNSGAAIDGNHNYELLDLCEDFSSQLNEIRLNYETLPDSATDTIWKIPELAKRLAEPAHLWLHWSPTPGALTATCLAPANWIAECLKPFGGSILMSATLAPQTAFRESIGLEATETTLAQGHAPWRDDAYNVAIDCRVDTRFNRRDTYYETTARTVASLVAHSPGEPITVFFPSYRYAENIQTYLSVMDPGLRAQVQPRGINLAEQQNFIQEALLTADALFLILGSSYAEGIDALGGRVRTAMVVSPALPEVNAIQDAKINAHHSLSREDAFRDVYIIPAMRRIHQALGRLVRAPGQNARILLHGKRYAEPAYHNQLAPEYQSAREIQDEAELMKWLGETEILSTRKQ